MPLKKGKSRAVIGENIKELEKAGHKPSQAIAISLKEAGKSKKGKVNHGKKRAKKMDTGRY